MRPIPVLAAVAPLFAHSAVAAPLQAAEEEPQLAFSWAVSSSELGAVRLPAEPTLGAWQAGPSNTLYRSIPSFTGDPSYEVLLLPPSSGHPTQAERFLLQFPADLLERPMQERAMVVGLHGFQQSEKSIFLNTELPWECASRGWILLAPYGMTDTHFGNVGSQQALEACVRIVYGAMPFNHRRVYAVGFSMGGLAALSFGMRHLDVHGLRFAGVAVHTAPLDLFQSWNDATPPLRELLSDELHFGATPEDDPFAWERVTPVRFHESGVVDPEHATVDNLRHVPVLLHANLADPLPHLVEGVQELKNHLLLRGATVEESLVFEPTMGHSWSTMDFAATLDFLGEQGLGPVPDESTLACDRTGGWLGAELRAMQANSHARYRLERGPASIGHTNAFALTQTRGVDELAIDVAAYGLDVNALLSFQHASADGTYDMVVLNGYTSAPGNVLVDGVPPRSLGFDEERHELRIVPTGDGHAVRVDVIP
ncbi:MAG: hypothetical protein KDC14_04130 [Planctomycetes bacterium]|nr:hypothetical protein [Planctomycetota bacterium]